MWQELNTIKVHPVGVVSALRGCDLVQMKIGGLVSGGQIRTRAIVVQQKTGRLVQLELLPDARASLRAWIERRGGTVMTPFFLAGSIRMVTSARLSMPGWSMNW